MLRKNLILRASCNNYLVVNTLFTKNKHHRKSWIIQPRKFRILLMKYQSIPNNQASILQQSLKFFYSLSTKNPNTLDLNSKEREASLLCSKLSRQTVWNLSLLKSESSMKVIKKESNTFKENRIFSERSHPASTSYKLTNHSISLRRKNPKMFKFTSSKKWNSVMKI